MKTTQLLLILLSTMFIACETEIDIVDTWQNMPVVYAVINPDETVHYVRINRTFLGNQSALDMATDPDSIQYNYDVDVRLNVYDENDEFLQSYIFEKEYIDKDSVNIDGNAVFARERHHVYVLRDTLLNGENYKYELNLVFDDGLVGHSTITPLYGFEHQYPGAGSSVDILNTTTSRFGCVFKMPSAAYGYDIKISLAYYDVFPDNTIKKETVLITPGKTRITDIFARDTSEAYYVSTRLVFNRFTEVMDSLDRNVERRFLGKIDFHYAIAEKNYTEFVFEQSSTINYETAPASNIRNCLGVFGSRGIYYFGGIRPTPQTMEVFHERLGNYKFQQAHQYPLFLQNLPDSLR